MLRAFLAGSGGEIVIPDAESVMPGGTEDKVDFVDAAGRVLVTFRRADLVLFTDDGELFAKQSSPDGTGAS